MFHWGFFCSYEKLQGCNSSQNNDWTNRSGLYVSDAEVTKKKIKIIFGGMKIKFEGNITGPVIMLLDQGRVFVVKKNKIVFGGMKFSYYIYLNKTQTLWMIE